MKIKVNLKDKIKDKIKVNLKVKIKDMTDRCFMCLSECDVYIKLNSCSCKIITHENCFNEYMKSFLKCMICKTSICKQSQTSQTSIYIPDNMFRCFLVCLFQNLYFYIDKKFLSKSIILFRLLFCILYHSIMLTIMSLILFFPWMIYFNIIRIYKQLYKVLYKGLYKELYKENKEYNVYKL